MNAVQLIAILRQAGWPENADLLIKVAAIGLAESSGNPRAHNGVPPDDSYGLWQINMIGSLGPQRRAKYGLSSNTDLYEPLTNAEIALDIYHSQGLSAWGSYTHPTSNPRYLAFMPQARAAYSGGGSSSTSSGNDTTAADVDLSATEKAAGAGAALFVTLLVAYFFL